VAELENNGAVDVRRGIGSGVGGTTTTRLE